MLWAVFLVAAVLPATLAAPADLGKDQGEIWAVLVAGTNGWHNYRHQSDVCHAYQIFHRHGIPDSNIIVMLYDDIANNENNPQKGVIINKPNGPNVYKGVVKDYTGEAVTPENFKNVLLGNSEAMEGIGSGKVLKSGPNDHVFINFVYGCGYKNLPFPNNTTLLQDDVISILNKMHKKKLYGKLAFYVQGCNSGSLFNGVLPKNTNVYAMTATKTKECASSTYWDDKLGVYLGSEFSVAWLEDLDSEEHHKNLTTETLKTQYSNAKKRVVGSHVSNFGEKKLLKDLVKDYFGGGKKEGGYKNELSENQDSLEESVCERDVDLAILNKNIESAENDEDREVFVEEKNRILEGRKQIDEMVDEILSFVTHRNADDINILKNLNIDLSLEKMSCYRTLLENFNEKCVDIQKNPFTYDHLHVFYNLCSISYTSTDNVLDAFSAVCTEKHKSLNGVN